MTENEMLSEALRAEGKEARGNFNVAQSQYTVALDIWAAVAGELRRAEEGIRSYTHALKVREAELLATTEFTGKNAEMRGSELLLVCEADAAYTDARGGLQYTALAKARLTDEMSVLRDTMSLSKRAMDMEIAWLNLLARHD